MAHVRQSRPDSGLGFQAKVRKTFEVVPSSLGSGEPVTRRRGRGAPRARCPLGSPSPLGLPNEEGTISNVLTTFTSKPRPDYGRDCLIFVFHLKARARTWP